MNAFSLEAPESPEIEKRPLRIIYIEDQEEFRTFIGSELKKFPADVEFVVSFSSTEEAEDYLIKLRKEKGELPDMIVSDDNLGRGKRKGLDFAKYLKEQGFETPFILYTNDVEQFGNLSEERLNAAGVTKVVDKFTTTGDLVRILNLLRN